MFKSKLIFYHLYQNHHLANYLLFLTPHSLSSQMECHILLIVQIIPNFVFSFVLMLAICLDLHLSSSVYYYNNYIPLRIPFQFSSRLLPNLSSMIIPCTFLKYSLKVPIHSTWCSKTSMTIWVLLFHLTYLSNAFGDLVFISVFVLTWFFSHRSNAYCIRYYSFITFV